MMYGTSKHGKLSGLLCSTNKCGSRIITTTRNVAIASYCSGDSSYVYQMESLNSSDSRRLFFKRSFGSEELCYPHLEEVSSQILAKCGGLSLAIITFSSLLADKHANDEWNRVLTAIGSALANGPNAGNMTKILSLSYFDLSHRMRTCLLYLSVFPEDHRIDKQRLIGRWVAEGFIHEERGRSAYEVGEGYFNDLINRNSVEHGHASDYRVRRLCVENRNSNKVTIPTSLILSHVRSLTVFGHCMQESLSTFPSLRVLDLGECWELENHHLANIGKLLHLKYPRLGQSRITELPGKIGELRYLETLDIRGTRIQELPPTIARLQRLAHLHVNHMIRFPDGVIGQMQSLEEVENFGVLSYEQGKCLREFSQLSKLRTLKVANGWSHDTTKRSHLEVIEGYLEILLSSCNLHHLYFLDSYGGASLPAYRYPVSLESSCPTDACVLRKLHITYCYIDKVPGWMSLLENLGELNLYMFSVRPEDVAVLGAIPSLHFLEPRTYFGTDGRILVAGFRSLKYFDLEIFCCGTSLEFEAGSMPSLEQLKLELRVHKMECLNGASDFGIHRLSALTKVEINIYGD
uniref:NB-ARC domain-containing protein n=1 Tax=Triticum urartu TaxID=4572 RepID=A0A8R7PMX7_TRIUA